MKTSLYVNGNKTRMECVVVEFNRERGQKVGDATNVKASAEMEVFDKESPSVDTKSQVHTVTLDGYRVSQKGRVKVGNPREIERKREMQLAIIREQEKERQLLDEDRDM